MLNSTVLSAIALIALAILMIRELFQSKPASRYHILLVHVALAALVLLLLEAGFDPNELF